jgi:hypothetical protein
LRSRIGQVRRSHEYRNPRKRQRPSGDLEPIERSGDERGARELRTERHVVGTCFVLVPGELQSGAQHVFREANHFGPTRGKIFNGDADRRPRIRKRFFARPSQCEQNFVTRRRRARERRLGRLIRESFRTSDVRALLHERADQPLLLRCLFEKAGDHDVEVTPRPDISCGTCERIGERCFIGGTHVAESSVKALGPASEHGAVIVS